jgi:phage-related protein
MKPVVWLGDSLAEVRSFVPEARLRAGQELRRVQAGEKKSRKTARLDVELARQRYRNLVRERN